jgi:hypothetical protein
MKPLLLWILALVVAAAPVVADVCRLDCARPDPPPCPQHQTTPHPCAHDHAIAAADLTRVSVEVSRPLVAAIVVALPDFRRPHESNDVLPRQRRHASPPRAPRTDILRI